MAEKLLNTSVPRHIAIILDGNGRWAKKRGLPRTAGHKAGAKAVEKICEEAYNAGVEYLTLYAFSTENWSRPADEVNMIMNLLRDYLSDSLNNAKKNNMKIRVIGDRSGLSKDIVDKIIETEEASKNYTGLKLQIAINYGGQDEIVRAAKKISEKVKEGELDPSDITKDLFENYLDTAGIPAPDLLIRTSGEQRLSNFLLWQLAYAEFYFTDVLLPDFGKKDLAEAIKCYSQRDRRYGGVKQ
ncbi:MAG: isoprenyl transferase [Lachnospiraceae bacterium]|nr:isoprenyl transferase [Lachnospiraceae bacterium]